MVTGQVNGVLTEHPDDETATSTGRVQGGVDGNFWLPFDSDPNNELGQPALPRQSNIQFMSEWQNLIDKCEPTEETVYVTQKPPQTKDVQAQTEKEVESVGVCETNTAPNWAEMF